MFALFCYLPLHFTTKSRVQYVSFFLVTYNLSLRTQFFGGRGKNRRFREQTVVYMLYINMCILKLLFTIIMQSYFLLRYLIFKHYNKNIFNNFDNFDCCLCFFYMLRIMINIY